MVFAFSATYLPLWIAVALAILIALLLTLRALERRRANRLNAFVDAGLAHRLLGGYDASLRRPLSWLTLLGVLALLLALAQPHWGQEWRQMSKRTHDIVICLDTSESMRAAAPAPTRLERARLKIGALLDANPGERAALVAFSGAAALVCPLTVDMGYFKAVLSAVDTNTVGMEGTDIAAALREAVKVFAEDTTTDKDYNRDSRAILLISDGEQVSGDAVVAAEEAAEYAHVYVLGVGDPDGTEVTLTDWQGAKKTHVSKLDEDTLIRVAQAGDGAYTRATIDMWDIEQLSQQIQALTAREVDSDMRFRLVNRFQWPLALAIACFMAEGIWLALLPWLNARRARRNSDA